MLFDFSTLSDRDGNKLLVNTIVPRPIAWVVTQSLDGRCNAAPFSFFNAVSGNPPAIMFGIGGRSPGSVKDTGANIRETGQFVVNLVSYELVRAMNVTAIDFPSNVDEIAEAGLTPLQSSRVKPPRIAESPVAMECERMMLIDINVDRTLVLGRVLAMHVRDDCVIDAGRHYIDTSKLELIGRMGALGSYVRTNDLFTVPLVNPEGYAQ